MKRITMILIATLTLAMLVYAQSRTPVQTPEPAQATRLAADNLITQAPQKRTTGPLIATPQDAQKAIQEGILGQLATKANTSLRNYPSAPKIRNITNPKTRGILERGRNLLETGKAANSWNATQLSGFANQLDQFLKEAEAAVKAAKPNNNGGTSQENCGAAKDRCNQRCHDRDAGYFCFFDCRLEYYTCLAGTIFLTSGGGVLIR